jgi:hypothetical protein
MHGTSTRSASYPFVSGDSFRADADYVLDRTDNHELARELPSLKADEVLFCEVDFLKNPNATQHLESLGRRTTDTEGSRPSLVIHNGDLPPETSVLEALVSSGWEVFCPNIVDELPGVHPIPIGIENLHWQKNGSLERFMGFNEGRQKLARRPHLNREIFASFNPATNPAERGPLKKMIASSRHKFFGHSLDPDRYKLEMSHSMFVVSPPGNGLDCHRTWEAIYLGAIPIIGRGTLSPKVIGGLGIWEVEDWDEALLASSSDLWDKYLSLVSLPRDQAFFPFWRDKLKPARRFA